jgi:hypothetical protein
MSYFLEMGKICRQLSTNVATRFTGKINEGNIFQRAYLNVHTDALVKFTWIEERVSSIVHFD